MNASLAEDETMCDFSLVSMPNESKVYDALDNFAENFDFIHTYLSITICFFGTLCNVANILVLTRRSMRTAVNAILCGIASCDCVVMLSNLVFICHYNLVADRSCAPADWDRNWALFTYLHSQLSVIGHSSSIWLSVAMGRLRYATLRSHGGHMRTRKPEAEMMQAYVSIVGVLATVTIFDIPNCLSYSIQEIPFHYVCPLYTGNATAFVPGQSVLALRHSCLIFRSAFWISGLFFKVVPCALLTTFLVVLVRILGEVKRRRARLLGSKTKGDSKGEEGADRTTRMLLTVICVFLATELPQGLLSVASGLLSREFRDNVYNKLGDVLDTLSLINSCATFVIYCSMSRQYRSEFARIFLPKSLLRRLCPCLRKQRHVGEDGSSLTVSEVNPSVVPPRWTRPPNGVRCSPDLTPGEPEAMRLMGPLVEEEASVTPFPALTFHMLQYVS